MNKRWKSNKLNKRMKAVLRTTLEDYFQDKMHISFKEFIDKHTYECCSSHGFQDGKLFFRISKIDKLPSEEELFSLPPGHIVDGTLKCEIDLKDYTGKITSDTLLQYYQ